MQPHRIVSEQEWLAERRAYLEKEKQFTRLRDELSRERRELPWVKVGKHYLFEGTHGRETLAGLFDGRSQLIVYHFMLAPGWPEGCPNCSFLADHFDGALPHLAQRDVTMLAISRAPIAEIAAFKQRMGWRFKWVSSAGSQFNYDYGVSFTADDIDKGATYNFRRESIPMEELPGVTVFYKDEWGDVFQTYSSYARGLDILLGAYNLLDLTPKGRDEGRLESSMSWVRHHDRYEPQPQADPSRASESCCASARRIA